ncbi:unnamed protein product [Effrenium voratum]|nr:unnamed protein product [Effrenium voratum]
MPEEPRTSLSLERFPSRTHTVHSPVPEQIFDVGTSAPPVARVSVLDEVPLPDEVPEKEESEVEIQVLVREPERRGISAGQFEAFFARFCGDVIYEELEEPAKPLCLPTTLCQLCVQANRKDAEVRNRSKRPRETNLYAVTEPWEHWDCELIIMPQTREKGVSYSELINPDGLQVDYFISHHWAEDFGEFVQSVLRHAIVAAPEMGGAKDWRKVVYWCCAFANNQHQVELGETLQKSPFYQALNSKSCKGTVMNLNQAATALDRIWCIYEVYLTHFLEKPFTLNFRLGPLVGVVQETKEKDSWVFHIFKMLQHIDVQQADATNPDDYKKIMGEIAHFSRDSRAGPEALNHIVKAMLGSQAIFTLARRGDLVSVRRALELDADPNIPDTLGIRPLTYAAGNGHQEVVQALIAGKADARAEVGANEVLAMFSPNRAERRRCIDTVRALDEEQTGGVHRQAISRALLQHTTSRCQALTSALSDADNAELRLGVVRELRSLLHALVDHNQKLQSSGADNAQEFLAVGQHARSLAPYLADPDPRVRLAVVEAVTSIGDFDLRTLKIPKRLIQEDNLHSLLDENTKQNVVHLAASQPHPNALYMLATGVDWALDPKALRGLDAEGRSVAHHAVAWGHMECLAMMYGEQKLPRSLLLKQDHKGRTAVHYAARQGDSGTLRALVDLASLAPSELCVRDYLGNLAMHLATAKGYWRFLGVLVNDCGLSCETLCQGDGDGRTVAHLAAATGDVACLRYLVEKCSMPLSVLKQTDHWHRTPAHDAAMADSPEVLALLQELGAPLHLPMGPSEPQIGAVAIVNQSSEVVAYLGNSYKMGRVHYVDRHQRMRFEYEKGIKEQEAVELERCELAPTPLVLAEKLGRKKASEFLGNAWGPIATISGVAKEELMNQARRGALPAGVLVQQGAFAAVEKFLQKGILTASDLVKRDAQGCSCLHRAAATGVPEAVVAILTLGNFSEEDKMAADVNGWTAAHHASNAGSGPCLEVVVQLCELGPKGLDAVDLWGRTCTHVAAEADAAEALQVLAKHQAAMHETMGVPLLEEGTVTLVHARENWGWATNRSRGSMFDLKRGGTSFGHVKSLGAKSEADLDDVEEDGVYTLGRITRIFGDDQVTIKHESGFREGFVEMERCTFCPTPIVLAERRGRGAAVLALLQVAWRPFVDAVQLAAGAVGTDLDLWEWEDMADVFKEEALDGARPIGAVLGVRAEGHVQLLRELLSAEVITAEELLVPDMRGRTALHRAALSGQADLVWAVKESSLVRAMSTWSGWTFRAAGCCTTRCSLGMQRRCGFACGCCLGPQKSWRRGTTGTTRPRTSRQRWMAWMPSRCSWRWEFRLTSTWAPASLRTAPSSWWSQSTRRRRTTPHGSWQWCGASPATTWS